MGRTRKTWRSSTTDFPIITGSAPSSSALLALHVRCHVSSVFFCMYLYRRRFSNLSGLLYVFMSPLLPSFPFVYLYRSVSCFDAFCTDTVSLHPLHPLSPPRPRGCLSLYRRSLARLYVLISRHALLSMYVLVRRSGRALNCAYLARV